MSNPQGNGYRVVVKESLSKVLFSTDRANLIEIFDAQENLCAVLMRVAAGALWRVSVKGEPDFESFARHHGYKTAMIAHPMDTTVRGMLSMQGT